MKIERVEEAAGGRGMWGGREERGEEKFCFRGDEREEIAGCGRGKGRGRSAERSTAFREEVNFGRGLCEAGGGGGFVLIAAAGGGCGCGYSGMTS